MKTAHNGCRDNGDRPEASAPPASCQESFERIMDAVNKLHERIDELETARPVRRPLARLDDCEAATVLILGEDLQ